MQPEEGAAELCRCKDQDPGQTLGCGRAPPPPPCLALCPQHSVTLVPVETFSSEFVEPRVHCVSSHGAFNPSR